MADNKKIAEQVLAAVGGAANLKDATHCMTRLRLYLKDDSLPKDDEVKKISGVLGVVRGGQQYQIVIGTNVPKVYEELCKLAGISASAAVKDDAAAAQDAAITKRKLTPKQVGKNIMGYLAGCMTPMIPVLLAGGLFRAVNSIFGPDLLGLYTLESNLYILFDFLYDAAFYFMPILVGYNAAKQLGVNGMLGSFIGSVLLVVAQLHLVVRQCSNGAGFRGFCHQRPNVHGLWYPCYRDQLRPDCSACYAVGTPVLPDL